MVTQEQWKAMVAHANSLDRTKYMTQEEIESLSEAMREREPTCPECLSTDIQRCHHQGDRLAPECDYWQCGSCEHQWGHE